MIIDSLLVRNHWSGKTCDELKRTHMGEKLFGCYVCKKCFNFRGNIWSQLRIQKGFSSNSRDKKSNTTQRRSEAAKRESVRLDGWTEDSQRHEISDDDCETIRKPQTYSKSLKHIEFPVTDGGVTLLRNHSPALSVGKVFAASLI